MTVMILQILSYGVYSNVDSSLKMAATKTNSYLEMEMLKRELFLTSEVDQNNTTTIYQAYDTNLRRNQKLKMPLTIYQLRQIPVS